MIESRTYPVFEFERKGKKRKRRRRVAVVKGMDSITWYPQAVEYSSRVKIDGGTMEAFLCVNSIIENLS